MPITRTLIRGVEPDEMGRPAHAVVGTPGADTYATQGGDKEVSMLGGNDKVMVEDSYLKGVSELKVRLGQGNDTILNRESMGSGTIVYGEDGNDRLWCGGGDDSSSAYGGNGNDTIRSLSSDEGVYMFGGPGNDRLLAADSDGLGDRMTGGPGVDEFYLADSSDVVILKQGHTGTAGDGSKPDTRDVIHDFDAYADPVWTDTENPSPDGYDSEQDKIDLSGIDANPAAEGDQAFQWVGNFDGKGGLKTGQVGWLHQSEPGPDDVIVACIGAGGRQAVVLEDFAAQVDNLGATDFIL